MVVVVAAGGGRRIVFHPPIPPGGRIGLGRTIVVAAENALTVVGAVVVVNPESAYSISRDRAADTSAATAAVALVRPLYPPSPDDRHGR